MSEEEKLECSFCGKEQNQVKKLIAGSSAYICCDCVDLCASILKQEEIDEKEKTEKNQPKTTIENDLLNPRKIREYLDQYVIGQDYAKMVVSVAVSNHYKRISKHDHINDVEISKSNCLFVGPSGSGKTYLAQSVARFLDVPCIISDATSMTESGYVGADVDSIISNLVIAAGYDIKKAERGIVFIDEIDKKAKRESASGNRDVSGEGVQQGLLKMLEGCDVRVPANGAKKNSNQDMITVNTKDILFVLGGAFVGLDKIVQKRLNKKTSSVGFGADVTKNKNEEMVKYLEQVESEDLIEFGLIPELVGRIPVIAHFHELSEEQLIEVLTQPKNSITKQFSKLFCLDKIDLEFTEEALSEIARVARKKKVGARGLRAIIERRLVKTQYDLADLREQGVCKILVNKNVIENNEEPEKIYLETLPSGEN